ncbi:MAG: hypothetical protein ACLPID_10460 [Beijerinckiaceae bacterium]
MRTPTGRTHPIDETYSCSFGRSLSYADETISAGLVPDFRAPIKQAPEVAQTRMPG